MATEIKMPQLGLTMEEGTVERWLKVEGDSVKAGEPIVEITTDKLTNQVEAEADGVLLKIVAQAGADLPVKAILGYIGQPGEQVGASAPAAAPSSQMALASTARSVLRPSTAFSPFLQNQGGRPPLHMVFFPYVSTIFSV